MGKFNVTIVRVVKPNVRHVSVKNPFTKIMFPQMLWLHDLPSGDEGDRYQLWLVLNDCFRDQGCAFVGLISEFINFAKVAGISETKTRKAFKELERDGFLKIEGDHFVPTQTYLDLCVTDGPTLKHAEAILTFPSVEQLRRKLRALAPLFDVEFEATDLEGMGNIRLTADTNEQLLSAYEWLRKEGVEVRSFILK